MKFTLSHPTANHFRIKSTWICSSQPYIKYVNVKFITYHEFIIQKWGKIKLLRGF